MTADEIKSKLGIDGAEIRLNDTQGWYWVTITRYHDGNRYTFSHRFDLSPSEDQIKDARETIEQWWKETTA